MRKSINYLLGVGLSLLITIGLPRGAPAQTTGNRILFESLYTQTKHGKTVTYTYPQIYSMNPDGSDPVQLTINGGAMAKWSHDGRYIAFIGAGDPGAIYVMTAEGEANRSPVIKVTGDVGYDGLAWAPDDTAICYMRYSTHGLWLVNVDPATGAVGTPTPLLLDYFANSPSWSPVVNKIAFNSDHTIKVLDPETGAETAWSYYCAHPSWSPDASEIAFEATYAFITTKGNGNRTTTNYYNEILIANPDGSNFTRVTNMKSTCPGVPTWSPDGKWLAFTSDESGVRSVYKLELSTGLMTLLHEGGQLPDWAP